VKLVNLRGTEPLKASTEAYMMCDTNALYIAFVCHEPKPEKLVVTQNNERLWDDDCVEVFIDPGHTEKNYYHFIINSKGTQADYNFNGSTPLNGFAKRTADIFIGLAVGDIITENFEINPVYNFFFAFHPTFLTF